VCIANGVAIDFSDIQGVPDSNAAASFEKELKDLDLLRDVVDIKMSDRKPILIKQDELTMTIRYFFNLSYSKEKYGSEFLPKIGKILKAVATGEATPVNLKLSREEFSVRMVELTQEPSLFKPDILDYTRGNPELPGSIFYVPNKSEFDAVFPFQPKHRELTFGYIDVVEKVNRSGMVAIRRYNVPGEVEAVYAKWCRSYRERLKGRKVVLSLLDATGEPIEEKVVNIRYPGVFNYPHNQPFVGFLVLAPRRDISLMRNNPETGYAYCSIVFSPMFIVPVRNSLQAGGLVETLECFVDVEQKKSDIKSIVKAVIKVAD
jgi:hypothetical protein